MNKKPLENFIVVVAGGSRGAGKGAALALGELGATIYVTARSSGSNYTFSDLPYSIEETARQINQHGGVGIPIQCDYTNDTQVKQLFRKINKESDKIDLLVNAAWGGEEIKINNEPFWKYPPEKWNTPFWSRYTSYWEYMFNRGVRNYLAASCYAAEIMVKQKSGLIINISYWDDGKFMGELFYDLAKTAMNRLAFGLAHELKRDNIAVLSLAPGFMKTEVVMAALNLNPEATKEVFGLPSQTTTYVGRAIAALACDSKVMDKSGKTFHVSDLAKEYGFTDTDGSQS
jgi:NAD(P)-dependent dehydrogenase (short-subunit alcohol dehydrogenase family)